MRARLGILLATIFLILGGGGALAASERYTLPGDNVFPEGIGAQASTGDFYVGSTTSGAVYRGKVGVPTLEVFLPGGADGRTDVRGLKADDRGRLYLAGGPTGQLFVYDIATKGLLAKFATGLTPTFVNDVAIAPNGDAYFTDSNSPAIYRVAANVTAADAFSRWIDLTGSPIVYAQGFNLNGIAVSADGKYLVVVQSNTGKLFRIEVATKAVTEIALGGTTVMGGDGVLIDGQLLWVMRNAAATLVALRPTADYASAAPAANITDPGFDFPTTFARVGDRILVVNSQLNKRQTNTAPNLPFVILGLPVPEIPTPLPSPSAMPSVAPTVPPTPRPSATPTRVPPTATALPPSPPPTGSGGNLPGLPSTGDGGTGGTPLAPVLAGGLAALLLAAGGLARARRRRA